MTNTRINERAWAVDVISEINRMSSSRTRPVRSAGGEWGVPIASDGKVLFPDVLLFGDPENSAVIQGWELKMPDTPITDSDLLANAEKKCRALGLSGFVVWNARDAALYKVTPKDVQPLKSWQCEDIKIREDVRIKRASWIKTLGEILDSVNDLLERRELGQTRALPDHIQEIVSMLFDERINLQAEFLEQSSANSRDFRMEASSWWRIAKSEHPDSRQTGDPDWRIMASEVVLHWVHRFLFAHCLKRFVSFSAQVDSLTIGHKAGVSDAERFFSELSKKHDYVQIFKPCLGAELMQKEVWKTLLGFNGILVSARFETIDQELLQSTLSAVRRESQRKVSGQFCTPRPLADLLVKLTIDDVNDPVFDPCCGTGTIARAALDFKIKNGMSAAKALSTTWVADKYAVPLQFATLSLASGETPNETIRAFQHDVMSLDKAEKIQFVHAGDGHFFSEQLPDFPCVIVTPPFVRFEDWAQEDPVVRNVLEFVAKTSGSSVEGKADMFAPIIFHLWRIVSPDYGRIGAIFPNTWLGTDWGESFRNLLKRFFEIEVIVTSAEGRWFEHAKVVANLVVLKRRAVVSAPDPSESIVFATTDTRLGTWTDETTTAIADVLGRRKPIKDSPVTFHEVTHKELDAYDHDGFCWTAHFASLRWVDKLRGKLISVSDLFDVRRGERRGWDDLFYPPDDCGVQRQYLKPVLKSASEVDCLAPQPDGRAFCCSVSAKELAKRGHLATLAWIRRFEHLKNGTGRPLKEVLARSGLLWYEMRPDTLADLAVSMNPNERLFFMRLTPRSFVNQRLIRLTSKTGGSPDLALCHALLCSVTSCFYLEALGFGRGLGVLDLNAGKIARQFRMLNPKLFSRFSKDNVLSCFQPLLKREVYGFEKEMASKDRQAFERAVLDGLGSVDLLPDIISSTLRLHRIRLTARDNGRRATDC